MSKVDFMLSEMSIKGFIRHNASYVAIMKDLKFQAFNKGLKIHTHTMAMKCLLKMQTE